MIASIINDPFLEYPGPDDFFSPHEKFPEYPFSILSPRKNLVYSAVRNLFVQAGLDLPHINTPAWNPLGKYVAKGDKVFILCNFVYHKRTFETKNNFYAKCTHASVLRALIDYAYIAAGPEGRICFGNAPLQSCDFQKVLEDTGAAGLPGFYQDNGIKVAAKDLRLIANRRSVAGNILSSENRNQIDGIIVSLDEKSLLNELYADREEIPFRVSDYNPERIQKFHQFNDHKYIIHKEILDSDVILSVPKLKTHKMVGLTVGLKGFVGTVGHKDCLAHHRFGPPKLNGDEFPDNGNLQILASKLHDFVQKRYYPKSLSPILEIIDKNLRRFLKKALRQIQAGGWYGNDTAWRMALDLAKIIQSADKNGELKCTHQRKNLVFIDGVIAGEKNGPLSPQNAAGKCLIFSDNIVLGDVIACKAMGWDAQRIPLIRFSIAKECLFRSDQKREITCILNGKLTDFETIQPVLGRKFIPPEGWEILFL